MGGDHQGLPSDHVAVGLRVLVHPQWGHEAEAVARLRTAESVTVVTRGSALVASTLDAVFKALGVGYPPARARFWVAAEVGSPVDGLPRQVPDLVVLTWSRAAPTAAQAEAEAHLRAAIAQAIHPGPFQDGGKADAMLFELVARLRGAHDGGPGQAPPGAPSGHPGLPDRIVPSGGPRPQPPPVTIGGWLAVVRDGAAVLGTALSERAEEYLAAVDASLHRARRSKVTPRASGAAARMLLLAATLETAHSTATPEAWDSLATAFVASRVGCTHAPSPVGWPSPVLASTARDDVSAVCEALRTRGVALPPYMGPRTAAYIKARGGMQRAASSNALPLSLAWVLSAEPPKGSPDHPVWASRALQAGFCLRPGMAGRVRRANLVPWGPGLVLVWVRQDKTRRADVERPNAPMRDWRISACGHPGVVAAVRPCWDAASIDRALLSPSATPARVLRWLGTWTRPKHARRLML